MSNGHSSSYDQFCENIRQFFECLKKLVHFYLIHETMMLKFWSVNMKRRGLTKIARLMKTPRPDVSQALHDAMERKQQYCGDADFMVHQRQDATASHKKIENLLMNLYQIQLIDEYNAIKNVAGSLIFALNKLELFHDSNDLSMMSADQLRDIKTIPPLKIGKL